MEENNGSHGNEPVNELADGLDDSACSIQLERMEDGKLVSAHLTYIRSCMRDMLSQIWSADVIETPRKGHQRDNTPDSEQVQEICEDFANSHVNIVDTSLINKCGWK